MASKKELQFGAPIPQVFFDGKPDMELVKNTAQRAEELGFHSLWVQDQVAGYVPLLESVGLMTYASAITTRVKLGVSVIVFPVRNPVQLAKNIATLDLMSNGRAILGLGLGPVYQSAYFEPFGMEAGQALRRFNEGLAIMKSLWTQHSTDLDGEFYTLHETGLEPKPIQKPHPPVWIGGRHPNALRRRSDMAMVTWAPAPRRLKILASTWSWCVNIWMKKAATRRRFQFQSACTWPWTTTSGGPKREWMSSWGNATRGSSKTAPIL